MFERCGDAMQLPDQLFKLAGTAEVHVAIVQEANCQHDDDGQADTEREEDKGVQ